MDRRRNRLRQSLGSPGAPRLPEGRAREQAGRGRTRGLRQEHDPDPVPHPPARRGGAGRARGDRHGALAAGAAGRHGRGARLGGAAAPRRATSCGPWPTGRSRSSTAPTRAWWASRAEGRRSRSTASRPTTSPSCPPTRAPGSRFRPTSWSRRSTGWRAPPPATRPAPCSPACWCGSAPTGSRSSPPTRTGWPSARPRWTHRPPRRSRRSSRPAR